MLESIKIKLYTILSIGILSIVGCTGDSTGKMNMESAIHIRTFAYENESLYIYYSKGYKNADLIKMAVLPDYSNKWINKDIDKEILDTSTVTYTNDTVTVKENDTIVWEDNLANISKIEEALGFILTDYLIKYTPFRVGKNFSWDRKTHIVSVAVDKEECSEDFCFNTIYYLSAIKQDNEWNINLIYKNNNIQNKLRASDMHHVKNNIFDRSFNKKEFINIRRISTSKNESFCFSEYNRIKEQKEGYCLVDTNSTIVKYENKSIVEIENNVRIELAFYHNDNYHVFYNLNSRHKDRGKYLLYEMYTKENPTIPVNQQKIYWE